MLVIRQSNRLELLAARLAEVLAQPPSDPLAKELVVVQGRGMALWLSMQLCRKLGIWANAEFVYPRHLVERLFQSVLPEERVQGQQTRYRREQLQWAIYSLLPNWLQRPEFAALRRYVGHDPSGHRAFELSEQVAQAYDEYLTFRPELLRAWQAESSTKPHQGDLFDNSRSAEHLSWQPPLWRALVELLGPAHAPELELAFLKALKAKRRPAGLPERISVFGLGALPPLYVRVLSALSRHCQVFVYRMSPSSSDKWAELFSTQTKSSSQKLLAAWGQQGHEAWQVWEQEQRTLGVQAQVLEDDAPNSGSSLLERVQNALWSGADLPRLSDPSESQTLAGDKTLSVHSCHSALREVEVLHDQILGLLERGVTAEEILVMMPDVDAYAPLIQAVFDRPHDPQHAVPYRISDRKPQGDSAVLEAFLRLLLLSERRVTASEVLDLLGLEPVHTRFEIDASELEDVTRWVVDCQIRWGIDAEHKARSKVPAVHQNSWRFGIERLLLGYAMAGSEQRDFAGILPYPEIEGSTGRVLGQFVDFAERVFSAVELFAQPHTPTQWHAILVQALADLVQEDEDNAWQHQQVRQALQEFLDVTSAAHFEAPLSLKLVHDWLARHFELERQARGFLSGGVTFCALVPMRSIPFRVIALLGMHESAFPRSTRRPDFNLLGQPGQQRPCDPNRRADDRYLFLEALCSARETFSISYVGQSIRDNSPSAPASVVTELLEQLRAPSQFVVKHPLQPFSSRYYDAKDERLYSYEQLYLAGAVRTTQPRKAPARLFDTSLPTAQPEQAPRVVTLQELQSFFRNPMESLLKRRLKINLRDDYLEVPDREPVELDGLESYKVGAPALTLLLDDHTPAEAQRLLQATGQLPHGALGQLEFERCLRSAAPLAELVQEHTGSERRPDCNFSIDIGEYQLRGTLDQLYADGRVIHHFSRLRATHHLRFWIVHLALCAARPEGVALQSVQIGRAPRDGATFARFSSVAQPLPLLAQLLQLFELGQQRPLPLFLDASFAYAQCFAQKPDPAAALRKAKPLWLTELKRDPALQKVYGLDSELELDGPTDSESLPNLGFAELATGVFFPLLAHLSGDSEVGQDE